MFIKSLTDDSLLSFAPGTQPLSLQPLVLIGSNGSDRSSLIESAAKSSQRGSYGKVEHASTLLKRARPSVAAIRCTSFQRLTQWLDPAIARA